MARTRREAVVIGLLLCVPVLLLGSLPALAWQVTHDHHHAYFTPASPSAGRGTSVRIVGTVRRTLRPGLAPRIDLRFVNVGHPAVNLRHVKVSIVGINAPRADATHPCTRADFAVRQMRLGSLWLPGWRTTDLAALAVPFKGWPRLLMRNRPVNQDGCKNATLTLSYRAREARR